MAVLIAIVVLIIDIALAVKFGEIAEKKGYSKTAYGWGVALLGIPMMIMVAALPDIIQRSSLSGEINSLRQQLNSLSAGKTAGAQQGRPSASPASPQSVHADTNDIPSL